MWGLCWLSYRRVIESLIVYQRRDWPLLKVEFELPTFALPTLV